jgi:superfamily I DNA and/or RNA helicase
MSCRNQGHGSNGQPKKQVGVVTFYGRQVRSINEAIRRRQKLYKIRFTAIDYDVNTVDRYQGQERPIILVSMVRNPPFKLSQRANTAQFERINVAYSRAQELLIIVGAKDVFCKYPVILPRLDKPGKHKVEVYRHIIDEIQRDDGLWSSDSIVSPTDYDRLLPKEFKSQVGKNRKRGVYQRDNGRRRRR